MENLRELEKALYSMKIQRPTESTSVDAGDFGMKPGKEHCNYLAMQRAIEYCRENHVGKLIIPKGVYYFKTRPADAHVDLSNLNNFVLDGQGSEFIFETVNNYLSLFDSHQVEVRDLYLDWNWDVAPLASVGMVSHVAEDGAYIECTFPEYKQVSEDMCFSIVGPFDPVRFAPGCSGGMEFRPYQNTHIFKSGDAETDKKMLAMVRELDNILLRKQEKVGSNILRFYTVSPEFTKANFHLGDCYRFRHYEYDIRSVLIVDSTDVTLSNITLYSAPGSGFVGNGDIQGLHFHKCSVVLRPGTMRSVTTTTDCLHVKNSKGHFLIEECDFGFAGDDCINIHDNSSMGITVLDSHTLLAERVSKEAILFETGYEVELRHPDFSPTGYCAKLTDVVYDEDNRTCKLTFAESLPEGLSKDTILWNRRFDSQFYLIRNCRFTNNRARGVLLQGSNGILENNLFENIQGAAIQIETGCESRWSEGHGVKNLIIRNNIIRHCDLNAWQMAVIYMGVYLPDGRCEYPVFQHILIENNTIIDCPRLAMYLSSCKDVTVRGNVIINSNQIPLDKNCYGSSTMEAPIYGETYHGTIQFDKATAYTEENNCIVSTIFSGMNL